MWSLASLCILLTLGRYVIRYRVSLNFKMDDIAHLCALGWLIVFASVTQAMFSPTKELLTDPDPPSNAVVAFGRLQTAQGSSYYLLHWTVKLAFLLLYRELFWISKQFIRAWWCVAAFVLIGFGIALAGILTQHGAINKVVSTIEA
jgi:hypothetical protein